MFLLPETVKRILFSLLFYFIFLCVERRYVIIEESCLSRDRVNVGSGPRSGEASSSIRDFSDSKASDEDVPTWRFSYLPEFFCTREGMAR